MLYDDVWHSTITMQTQFEGLLANKLEVVLMLDFWSEAFAVLMLPLCCMYFFIMLLYI